MPKAKSNLKLKSKSKAKSPAKGQAKATLVAKPKAKVKIQAKAKGSEAKAKAKTKAAPKATAAQAAPKKAPSQPPAKVSAVKPGAKNVAPAEISGLFTPLDDRVLVLREAVSDRTPGGLYIPDTVSMDRPNRGRVVAVGRGHRDKKGRLRPLDVQLNDTILFSGMTGSEIKLGLIEVLVLREQEIIAVVGND